MSHGTIVTNKANSIVVEALLSISELPANSNDNQLVPCKRGARAIVPDFNILNNNLHRVQWPAGTIKPALKELHNEILVRQPSSCLSHYNLPKCLQILKEISYLPSNDTNDNSSLATLVRSPARKKKHSRNHNRLRLINSTTYLKEQHLTHNWLLHYIEIDAGEMSIFLGI